MPSSLKLLRHESQVEEEANAQAEAQEKMSRGTSKLACPPTQAEGTEARDAEGRAAVQAVGLCAIGRVSLCGPHLLAETTWET